MSVMIAIDSSENRSKMNLNASIRLFAAIFLMVGCVSVGNADGEGRVSVMPFDEISWAVLPDGRAIATLRGDREAGEHTTYVQFPAGFRTAIHTHSNDYDGTIIRGTARHYEPQFEGSAKWLALGSAYHVPADTPHISECSEKSDCVFAIHQHGPFDRSIVE